MHAMLVCKLLSMKCITFQAYTKSMCNNLADLVVNRSLDTSNPSKSPITGKGSKEEKYKKFKFCFW